ncbi:cellulose biosynthesis protein BcsQ [Yokenella regensburgei]|jgi:cellulose synthase operon protein YhjQ|uniref:Cell division protein n=2 Tax=Yokenella regensburgei TaxID=158877 RepID=A0AB38G016_9ENTR|nr:cellulose biosynthesis protein BcsQ [Yokenella regensburgei]EHM49977.1 cellulose synthase operon protein YhjQ [Yokenella regensburgei ATCC 43003]KFD24595.1 putative cellulose synthase [Yokenella regensburgei ATCC 49455]MDQ4429970.1 cellulose biosynthesis protein BcsQ [Yokenella regensburgei]QIU90884.1 cellulose biosynthesis protein BcsQ [Yokenella regensburgei]SQA64335.1 cell division protein [Yokenella regensburgei]
MAILGLQGIRGGVGTTSLTAALAWSLQSLGETVLVVDTCADNMLRMSFNVDFQHSDGWMRALLDGKPWQDSGLRYTPMIDLLPFGQLTHDEKINLAAKEPLLRQAATFIQELHRQGHYQWILLDLPHGYEPWVSTLLEACHHVMTIVNPDTNCHVRLHQQALPANAHILLNDLRLASQLQDDLYQIWLQSQRRLLPIAIHRDEAMAESMASKQPLGEYRSDSLAAEEMVTLANWCLLHYAGTREPAGSEA